MFQSLVRVNVFFALVIVILATACSSAGASSNPTPVAAPTSVPASPTTVVAAPTATQVPATSAPPASASSSSAAAIPPASGNTVRLVVVPGKSQAGYRVREQLANMNLPSDAVGTTNAITGTIIGKADGTIVSPESKFVVDLSTLKSDSGQRDNYLRRSTLETNQYPTATFVPKSTSGLPATLPPSGPVAFKLNGDLTIRNVTKPVTWEVTCQPQSTTEGTCNATTTFTFGEFGLTIPRVFSVLSIADSIKLEISVALQRS
ncbi:MAG: YceI family protein [Chloroflexi bacterium]|nr:YceI family protein [Chloroflexota bacterium]